MRRVVAGVVLMLISAGCGSSTTSSSPTAPRTATVTAPAPPPPPNFQGQWSGRWAVVSCTQTGGTATANFCGQVSGGGLTLTLTQSGTTAQGTLSLVNTQITVSGPISATGTLVLTGQGTALGAAQTLNNWQSQISGNSMTGAFTWTTFNPPTISPGSATIVATLQGVIRSLGPIEINPKR